MVFRQFLSIMLIIGITSAAIAQSTDSSQKQRASSADKIKSKIANVELSRKTELY